MEDKMKGQKKRRSDSCNVESVCDEISSASIDYNRQDVHNRQDMRML